MVAATLDEAPGFAALYHDLCAGVLALRPRPQLPAVESAVEALIRHILGDETPLPPRAAAFRTAVEARDFTGLRAPRGYRAARPVPLWPDLRGVDISHASAVETRDAESDADSPTDEPQDGKTRRARRRKADEIDRTDSFILHKFEAILSWAEFINLNRRVEDDDDDSARKAADDQDEIGLGQISQAPATRLKLHLDLAPEDVDREALSDILTYPEWDVRTEPAPARALLVCSSLLSSPSMTRLRFGTTRAPPRVSAPSRDSSRPCVPGEYSRPDISTATISTWSAWCARGSIFLQQGKATTASGCKPAANGAIWRCRSCSTCRARPRGASPGMAARAAA